MIGLRQMYYVVLTGISHTVCLPRRRQSRSTHAPTTSSPWSTVRVGYKEFSAICRA